MKTNGQILEDNLLSKEIKKALFAEILRHRNEEATKQIKRTRYAEALATEVIEHIKTLETETDRLKNTSTNLLELIQKKEKQHVHASLT